MGSITKNSGGGDYIYRSSKAAANQVMRSFAGADEGRDLIVANFHPGWVKTDMGGGNAAITSNESVKSLRKVIAGLTEADSGKFFNYDGNPYPW